MWRFPKMGVPPAIIYFNGIFPYKYKPSILWVPPFMETPMCTRRDFGGVKNWGVDSISCSVLFLSLMFSAVLMSLANHVACQFDQPSCFFLQQWGYTHDMPTKWQCEYRRYSRTTTILTSRFQEFSMIFLVFSDKTIWLSPTKKSIPPKKWPQMRPKSSTVGQDDISDSTALGACTTRGHEQDGYGAREHVSNQKQNHWPHNISIYVNVYVYVCVCV